MITKCNFIGDLVGGKWDKMHDQYKRVYGMVGHSPSTPTCKGGGKMIKVVVDDETKTPRIRRLIPLECWRLMGFADEDFYKAQSVCSDTQLIKQAGNSIGVPAIEGILKKLFLEEDIVA